MGFFNRLLGDFPFDGWLRARCPAAQEERDDEHDEEDYKDDFRKSHGGARDGGEA